MREKNDREVPDRLPQRNLKPIVFKKNILIFGTSASCDRRFRPRTRAWALSATGVGAAPRRGPRRRETPARECTPGPDPEPNECAFARGVAGAAPGARRAGADAAVVRAELRRRTREGGEASPGSGGMDRHDGLAVAPTPLIDVPERPGVAWYAGGSVASTVHGRFRATNESQESTTAPPRRVVSCPRRRVLEKTRGGSRIRSEAA